MPPLACLPEGRQAAATTYGGKKIQVYFAHPYSPWKRPTNENSNGLIRHYFPKGTDFSTITKKELKRVEDEHNESPRNVLNWKTPNDVFEELILQKIV